MKETAWDVGRSPRDKERRGILSSMQKPGLMLGVLAVSTAAIAATHVVPPHPSAIAPMLLQAIQLPSATPTPAPLVQSQPSYTPAAYAPASAMDGLSRWRTLRQTSRLPFNSYSSFLLRYRGWPGETSLRKDAEQAIDPNGGTLGSEVIAFFQVFPPLTNAGHARYAVALKNAGRNDEAIAEARIAWRGGALAKTDEDSLLALFGASLRPEDHDARIEALLDGGQVAAAQRFLGFTSQARRPFYDTRIAIQTRAPDADSKLSLLGPAADADAGIILDRATALRNGANEPTARALLARPRTLTVRPSDADKWYGIMWALARGAAHDGQASTAWQIASQLDDAYPVGTDVSGRPYDERDEYTNLAWLAGSTALNQLGRSADAVSMFVRYAHAARSPQTQAKGFYWAGRASAQAGQAEAAAGYFEQAAAFPDQFYGQLALERLGRPVPAPQATLASPTPAARAAFQQRDLVAVTRYLGQAGRHDEQTLFIRALADSADTDEDRQLAAELGKQIGRVDLGVWVARAARSDGRSFYALDSFPELALPGGFANQWALSHGIGRQESSFDRAAVSPAGALGIMQLMPGTAGETARRMGLPYERSRLTSDPSYNIMLGSAYFARLLEFYGGYAPLAVAAYNAGAGNVNNWLAKNGDPRTGSVDVVRWIEEIPLFETRNYVQRVLENAVVYDTINPNRSAAPQLARLSWYLGKTSRPG